MFHPTEAPRGRLCETAEEAADLGDGWVDTPAKFPIEPVYATVTEPDGGMVIDSPKPTKAKKDKR